MEKYFLTNRIMFAEKIIKKYFFWLNAILFIFSSNLLFSQNIKNTEHFFQLLDSIASPDLSKTISNSNSPYQFVSAINSFKRNNYAESINTLDSLIKTHHDTWEVQLLLAYTYFLDNKFDDAIKVLNLFIAKNKSVPFGYLMMGNCLLKLKSYSLAINNYSIAIKLDSMLYEAYNNRACIRILNQGVAPPHSNDLKLAKKDLVRVLEITGGVNDAVVYYNLGYINIGLKLYQEGIQYLTTAIEMNPQYGKAYHERGLGYFLLKDYSRAYQDILQAMELGENNKEVTELFEVLKKILESK